MRDLRRSVQSVSPATEALFRMLLNELRNMWSGYLRSCSVPAAEKEPNPHVPFLLLIVSKQANKGLQERGSRWIETH
jgi:hypothetical protein